MSIVNLTGSIASGGVAQQLGAADAGRSGFFFRNQSSETLYLDFGATATTNSLSVAPGEVVEMALGGLELIRLSISVLGATTGSKFWSKAAT